MAMEEQEKFEFDELKRQVEDLRYILAKKTGGGSADVKANIVAPSNVPISGIPNDSITKALMADDSIGKNEWDYEQVSVTVSAGQSTGTATVTSGSIIVGFRFTGNNDQFVDNIAVSGTTLTITLAANATADNTFQVTLIKT